MSSRKDLQLLGRVGILLTVPVILAAGPLIGIAVGGLLDQRWRTAPWALLVCAVAGGLGSIVEVYRILRWIARFDRSRRGDS